jgi:hypothetical protein
MGKQGVHLSPPLQASPAPQTFSIPVLFWKWVLMGANYTDHQSHPNKSSSSPLQYLYTKN